VGTGYGDSGPYAHKGGQDVLAQAMSGVMARRSDPSVPITVYPTALADYSAGMHMVQGILLALLHRGAPVWARRSACRCTTRCWRCRCRRPR
jgi:crotonobetainyl-CoA:carnitine CoA-transferase CaiB-like acyl-CoA transferase